MPPRQSNKDRDTGRGSSSADQSWRVARLERLVIELFRRSVAMEKEMAIDFSKTTAALEKIKGAEASTKKLVADMSAKLAELSASITNPEDQAKVDEFAAQFAAEADNFPQAVAANPAPADNAGGSTGGIKPTE